MDFLRQNIYRDGQAIDRTVQSSYDRFTPTNLLKYALPTRENVLHAQKENNLTTLEDTIQWFRAKAGNKFGIRQKIESMVFI
jgi:3-hydroxyisobutyryl-CoA hydrolase